MKYVVYLTMYKGTLLPKWYIGSSYEEKVKNGYAGSVSSKKWSNVYYKELKENRHLFKTRILSYHETRKEAFDEELRLQKMHNVVKSKLYYNESLAHPDGPHGRDVSGELNPMFGKTHTDEVKQLLSDINKNKVVVVDKEGNRLRVDKTHPDYISGELVAESKGRKASQESRMKMSETRKGNLNKNAKKFEIYNANNEKVFYCHGNFKQVVKENKLPYGKLIWSAQNNGSPIYVNTKEYLIPKNYKDFIGWYAKIIKE